MVVTFCGHSDFRKTEEYERKILAVLSERVGASPAEMYLGGYGGFDSFAFECCKKYKRTHPNVSLVFVSPYLNIKKELSELYDSTVYPEIESHPPRFAVSYRNRYMVERADLVIAYIERSHGGAYAAYAYAKRKGKEILNLADKF